MRVVATTEATKEETYRPKKVIYTPPRPRYVVERYDPYMGAWGPYVGFDSEGAAKHEALSLAYRDPELRYRVVDTEAEEEGDASGD